MSCKYKKYQSLGCIYPWCYVTGGECQFLNSPYDEQCAILSAYPNVPMDDKEYNIMQITNEAHTDILNILT